MEDSIRDTIRRHRFALELAIGKLESESEAVVRLLKGVARELQEIDAQEQRHDEGLKEARDKGDREDPAAAGKAEE